MVSFHKKNTIFAQGDSTDGLFFIQKGKVQLTVVSDGGKEATLGILGEGDFFGEGGLAGQALRMSSAGAMTDCVLSARWQERHDAGLDSTTKIVGPVSKISAEAKCPISG
jgi:CRP-like cAMP-binding protein